MKKQDNNCKKCNKFIEDKENFYEIQDTSNNNIILFCEKCGKLVQDFINNK